MRGPMGPFNPDRSLGWMAGAGSLDDHVSGVNLAPGYDAFRVAEVVFLVVETS
jgi:hypothetical protein